MAYDEGLARRIRDILGDRPTLVEKRMFGGIAFMLHGNFACGVNQENLVVRVGQEKFEAALAQPHCREMDFTGRPMKGWVYVSADGYREEAGLADWVQQGVDFALSLPPK